DAVLGRVVHFLKPFPAFYEIVAKCARKSDMSIWPRLFNIIGNPQSLFQECLELKFLRTATSYLIIIQTLE
ncbi:ribosome control protein 1, partial [Chytriomyces sp. MP71]